MESKLKLQIIKESKATYNKVYRRDK